MARPLTLLGRSWLPGKGCVHFRSTALSEEEARELLEAARGAIERAQQSDAIEVISIAKGRAFVQARRSPDPDHPNRAAPGFVLVSIPDGEFDDLIRSAAREILDGISPLESESNLDSRGLRLLDLGGPTLPARDTVRRSKWVVSLLGALVMSLALVACFLWLAPGAEKPPSSRSSESDSGSESNGAIWGRTRLRIREILTEPWTVKVFGGKTDSNPSDRDLLGRFALLFRRPDLELGEGTEDYELRKPADHPFVAFLLRLPETIDPVPGDESDLTAAEAMEYVRALGEKLDDTGIHLDVDDPDKLPEQVRSSLDYGNIFAGWKIEHPGPAAHFVAATMWDEGREMDVAYHWVKPVRELIRARYWRP